MREKELKVVREQEMKNVREKMKIVREFERWRKVRHKGWQKVKTDHSFLYLTHIES